MSNEPIQPRPYLGLLLLAALLGLIIALLATARLSMTAAPPQAHPGDKPQTSTA